MGAGIWLTPIFPVGMFLHCTKLMCIHFLAVWIWWLLTCLDGIWTIQLSIDAYSRTAIVWRQSGWSVVPRQRSTRLRKSCQVEPQSWPSRKVQPINSLRAGSDGISPDSLCGLAFIFVSIRLRTTCIFDSKLKATCSSWPKLGQVDSTWFVLPTCLAGVPGELHGCSRSRVSGAGYPPSIHVD